MLCITTILFFLSGTHNCISIDYGNLKVMCNHFSKTLKSVNTVGYLL